MENLQVKIKLVGGGKLPEYKRDGDACLDCYARLADNVAAIKLPQNSRCLVNLGFALELPQGWEAVIRPRSGLSKLGIDNAIGTIDSNYRGEVKACVINNSGGEYSIAKDDRICQLAIRKAPKIEWEVVNELSETVRGENGFGSSGK